MPKANSILGMLKNTFTSRDGTTCATLFRTYVRPHLEFAISAWNPYLKRDIMALEKVQRRATRLPTAFRDADYEVRRARMGLTSLENRRLRGDLIQMFKIVNGFDNVNFHSELLWSQARANKRPQLRREIVATSIRHNFLFNRISNAWNLLPDYIVQCKSVNEFKIKIDNWLTTNATMAAL